MGDHGLPEVIDALERLLRPGVPSTKGGTGGMSPCPLCELYIPVEDGGLDPGLEGVPFAGVRFSSPPLTFVLLFHVGRPARLGGVVPGASEVRDLP